MHGEEKSPFSDHAVTQLVAVLAHRLEWEGAQVWWEERSLMVIRDANGTLKGDSKFVIDHDFVVFQFDH